MSKRRRSRGGRPKPPDPHSIASKPETGPYLYTFTFRLPLVLGFSDNIDHEIGVPRDYLSEDDEKVFGRPPFVRVRIFNADIPDRQFAPANVATAIKHFYSTDTKSDDPESKHLYEQWVTLETPAVFLSGEQQWDPAYAFHRGIFALNIFLEAFAIARHKDWVRPISTRELRPIVVLGTLDLQGKWTEQGPMLMHPDAKPSPMSSHAAAQHVNELNSALETIINHAPFVRARQWRARAERRKSEGDAADAIVSFQIAAEMLLYELWGLLLLEEGVVAQDVASRRADQHFTTLLSRELCQRLGGTWDLTTRRSAVGRYWFDLYKLRNRIVHTGYQTHDGDAEQAERAFLDLDRFIDQRLRAKAKKYPAALKAKAASGE